FRVVEGRGRSVAHRVRVRLGGTPQDGARAARSAPLEANTVPRRVRSPPRGVKVWKVTVKPTAYRRDRMKVQDMEHSIPFSSELERNVFLPSARRGGGQNSHGLDDMVFDRLLQERVIFLGSEVNSEIANRLCAQLILLEAEDPERDIKLYINSPGGSVYDGMAIYDTMQYIKNDVATVAMGMAASMGQLLLCAGTAGKRYA